MLLQAQPASFGQCPQHNYEVLASNAQPIAGLAKLEDRRMRKSPDLASRAWSTAGHPTARVAADSDPWK